jgi:hypothetical protein
MTLSKGGVYHMGLSEQFSKIKDNWLILILLLVVLVVMSGGLNLLTSISGMSKSSISNYGSTDFAPDVTDRKIVKTTYLTSEIKRGQFSDAESRVKSTITASGAYLLNEEVSKYGDENHPYFSGNYQIKVDTAKYDAVVSQLKEIGVVDSFNEKQADITGSYTNTRIELAAEKERLARYESMFKEATIVADRITLNDRIFDQERTIKYQEESLKNMGQRVDYSTIYLTLNEKRSEYEYITFVRFSELISTLVGSLSALFQFIFGVAPWALLVGAIVIIVKRVQSRG